jgi:hypothetical protein
MFCIRSQLAPALASLALVAVLDAAEFWSDSKECLKVALEGVTTTRYEAIHKQGIRGAARYTGDAVIRGVKVCGGGSCTDIFAGVAMQKGQSAEFLLTVDNLDPVTLSVECEVLD